MITDLEPEILECEVKWALESITMNKASGGDGIPAELFQILEDGAVKVLHSICQQVWKTQQWPQDWKSSVFFILQLSHPYMTTGKTINSLDKMDLFWQSNVSAFEHAV